MTNRPQRQDPKWENDAFILQNCVMFASSITYKHQVRDNNKFVEARGEFHGPERLRLSKVEGLTHCVLQVVECQEEEAKCWCEEPVDQPRKPPWPNIVDALEGTRQPKGASDSRKKSYEMGVSRTTIVSLNGEILALDLAPTVDSKSSHDGILSVSHEEDKGLIQGGKLENLSWAPETLKHVGSKVGALDDASSCDRANKVLYGSLEKNQDDADKLKRKVQQVSKQATTNRLKELRNPLNGITFTHQLKKDSTLNKKQNQLLRTNVLGQQQLANIPDDMDFKSTHDCYLELNTGNFNLKVVIVAVTRSDNDLQLSVDKNVGARSCSNHSIRLDITEALGSPTSEYSPLNSRDGHMFHINPNCRRPPQLFKYEQSHKHGSWDI
ncbi:Phytochrome [Nymphaea thermarum]|nr:Phytochrome [Nymphaea thermarum]